VSQFGPEYPKIQTAFKRDERNIIIPGDWTLPEFAYLADLPWIWTEKIDGTNIRLHFDGTRVTIGGRTENAQVPKPLVANLGTLMDPKLWVGEFPQLDVDDCDMTVYGEGYGAKIQSGGMYRQDQALIVFDVRVGPWWLLDDGIESVASSLGLETVPRIIGTMTLNEAAEAVRSGKIRSRFEGARIEGLVGRPAVPLFNRKGERCMVKIKAKDFADHERRRKS
jgi:RNA ligase